MTKPKEKPITFSGAMVRALLNTEPHVWPAEPIDPSKPFKWQTRRVHKKPRYAVSDVLWVREPLGIWPRGVAPPCIMYKADSTLASFRPWKWQTNLLPSIFMPKWAARISLVIGAVHEEYLRDIHDADVEAEGFVSLVTFVEFWDGKNGKRGYSWESNPLVCVYEFMRLK